MVTSGSTAPSQLSAPTVPGHSGVRLTPWGAAGTVTGTCTALHLGRTLTTHEIVMTDEQGRRLSTARITNMLRENQPSDR